MPRSSRHKSSKHSSRDAREYSESEDDLGAKERSGGNEEEGGGVRVLKDSVLSEKRKLDGKESRRDGYDGVSGNGVSGNGGEYMEDYGNSSSKRRKERGSGDGVGDRWNGGGENAEEKGDGSRKARGSGESKSSRRREDGIEEIKKGGGRSEKHGKESSRKEGKEKEKERERDGEKDRGRDRYKERDREKDKEREMDRESEKKVKEGKGEKFIDNEDERLSSKREIATDSKADLHVRNSEPDDILERRNRKRNENSSDKYQDEIGDVKSKRAPSVDDVMKDRRKDEKRRDEKYRDSYRDETEKSRLDKYKDDYPVKDRSRSRSREKYTRDDKDHADVRQKKMKPRYGDQENDFLSSYDHSRHRDRDRDQERDGDREHDGYRKRDQVSGRDRNRNPMLDKETERDRDYDRERERDHVRDQEPDMGHYDERSGKDKDRRGRRTSPDEQDEYGGSKARGSKALNTDLDKVSLNSSRIETDGKGDGSRSRSANVDVSTSNRRVSPIPISYGDDGYKYARPEDLKYRDLQMENRLKENAAEATERSLKYRSLEKHNKTDDGLMELTSERSMTSKPSPMGLTDGSPSPSLDRRYMNRSGYRRSLDVEDAGRRRGASADTRDVSVAEVKSGRDLGVDKPTVEESSQADSSFSNRQAQGNMNPLPPFRPGVESPTFMGMIEDDSRPNSNSRYKRTGDPGMGRGHVNSWRGVPSWPSPLPNGFMPFQSGLPHGNFQPIMPHFPSPPIFGFRPPMEINQPGMPFPLADTDRFSGHLRPLGWPNMIDPSGPPRLHGWDVNNGVLRGESHLFGADWEHNRHPIDAREWESNVDMWKGHNGSSADFLSANNKDSTRLQLPVEDGFAGQGIRKSYNGNSREGSEQRGAETRPDCTPPGNETSMPSSEGPNDKKQVSTKVESMENIFSISQFYLSKLDISEELTHPEVYKQCMDLLDGRPGLTVDNDPLALIILTNDRRGSRAADDSLSSYVLPTADDSTFQRALDLYKNKRLGMRDVAMMKIDPLDSMLSTHSNDMNKRAGVPTTNEEKAAPDRDGEEGLQSTILTSDLGKIVDGANSVEDDIVDESGVESVQSNVHGSETEVVVVEKQENSRTVPVDHTTRSNDIPQATSPEAEAATADQPRVEDIITTLETEISGKVGSDSVVGGGQSEACEVVSNESELVNYGRIHHHSPESTH